MKRLDSKLWFFRDKETGQERNTGVIASSEAEARKKLKRPPSPRAELMGSRALTEPEKRVASKGRWVRGRLNGDPPSKDSRRGFGPRRARRDSAKKQGGLLAKRQIYSNNKPLLPSRNVTDASMKGFVSVLYQKMNASS